MIFVWKNEQWVEGTPVNGQKFKKISESGTVLESFWYEFSLEETEKQWRDQELKSTDWIVPITDHPQHSQYMAYRQALRDWPSTTDFPDTRPELGD